MEKAPTYGFLRTQGQWPMAWPFGHAGGQQKPGRMGHRPMEITVALEGCTKMGELVCSNRLYVKWLPPLLAVYEGWARCLSGECFL